MNKGLIIFLILLTGCTQQHFKETMALSQVNNFGQIQTQRPACEIDAAEYELNTKILSYEITDTTNVKFGFSLLSGFLKAFGLSLKSSRGQMALAMEATDGLQPQISMAAAFGGATSTGTEFSANIDLAKLFFDVNYYYQTPLSKLTENGLKDTFNKITDQLNQIQTPWQTNVLVLPSQELVVVPVGTIAGIKTGDTFKIYNVNYVWSGAPCASELKMKLKTTQEPIAIVKAEQVEKNAASLRVIFKKSDEEISQGAVVEIVKSAQSLKRPLRFGDMSSGKIIIGDKNEFQILEYAKEQIKAIVLEKGFYIRK